MKILFLSRRFWPSIGGVEKHTLAVAKELIKLGHKVMVITEKDKTQNLKLSKLKTIKIRRIPVSKSGKLKKFQIWRWLWQNRKLIEKAEIIHAHDVGFWYFPFRFFYPRKPFFITFHGWERQFPIPLKNKIIRKISEKLARGNICVGDYLSQWYRTRADYVVYGAASFLSPPRRSPHFAKGFAGSPSEVSLKAKLITFIGRLEEDTGLPVYLQAFQKFKVRHPQFQIQFLGDGSLRKKAEKYGKVLGFVKEVRPYLLQSRFIFASGYLSLLEAMICQRLVFAAYDNPLKKDSLKMAPFARWIVMEKDPEKLAEKIKYYLDHPEEEKKLINQAYDWAQKQTWKKIAETYLKLWKKKKQK